jgi:PiT family inorganic phosphate transporter
MLLQVLLLVLIFVTVALVAGNNLSACIGPIVGSKILSRRASIFLGATGFATGLTVQGTSMIKSIQFLLPSPTIQLQLEVFLVAILVFVVADVIRAPIPLSMSLVGLFAGLSIARSTRLDSIYLSKLIFLWFLAPVVAIVFAFYLRRIVRRERPENIWRRVQAFKILLVVLAFTTSYVLGANTLGLIVATGGFNALNLITAVTAIFVGSFLLSRGEIKRSQELFLMRYPNATVTLLSSTVLVEFATLFNIPLSNTQTLESALFGTAVSYRTKFISLKPVLIIILGWVIAPLLSFAIGLII